MALTVTVEVLVAQTSVALVERPERSGLPVIVIASVFPVVAVVEQPLSVRLLIVRFVVPAVFKAGVEKRPLLPAVTAFDTPGAAELLSPVKV